jgi:predicted ATPase/class 3 adenylate cyclase/DNA-binding winged helix-turn-helix (wHTH) protein
MLYVFANCTLDTQLYVLRRADRVIALRSKVFQVLAYLLEHRDRVVSKNELLEAVWPEQFISDATLSDCIRTIRQAVGDNGRDQRFVQTRHGYGYRFVAPVTVSAETCEEAEAQARPVASGAAALPLRDPAEAAHAPIPLELAPASGPLLAGETSDLPQSSPLPVLPPDQTTQEAPPSTVPGAPEVERRQLTVMFCDLVGSTALSEQLAPEDLYDVIRAYQDVCAGVIQHFDGHIAQYLGDGLLVYFGYPFAHEDDAQRAVHAGLGMIEALGPLQRRLAQDQGVQLAVRIGIHTGLVIVGALGTGTRQEHLALGDTPNIAARIQELTMPDTIVISEATARLIRGFFTCQPLEAHALKGMVRPVTLYRVLGATEAQNRLDVVDPKGLTPLAGRHAEVALLLERWTQVKEGFGQVLVLSGEAGIGKSRLVQVLKDHLAEESVTRLECRCLPYHQHSAWYPIIELLRRLLHWQRDEAPDAKWRKLETVLGQYGLPLEETVPIFAALLSLPDAEARYPLPHLTPLQQRRKTVETILVVMLALTDRHPVLLIVEDLHWVDPSTLEVLTLLVEHAPTIPLCLVVTCRPTFQVPWSRHSYLTQITLPRLPQAQVEQMVTSLTGGKAMPPEVLQRVVDKTDGVPLFVEELTKAILESGLLRDAADRYELTAPLRAVAIPATLHDSLRARLDRLGTAKSVAQLGAVLGRRVPYALLRAVAQQDDVSLQRELRRLVEAELLYQYGIPPRATYVFKHALIQEAAYQSLMRNTRQYYHQNVAQALVAQFPEAVETQPELLAHHYTEAGLAAQAVPYWQRAGERAGERSANVEAVSHLTQGLEVLKTLPDTPERARQELGLQLALGPSLRMIKGHTAPEVEYTYTRAYELSQHMGNDPQRFAVLVSLWRFYLNRAQLQTARGLAEQCLALAQYGQDPVQLQDAHRMLGSIAFFQGEPVSAQMHLEQGLILYDAQQGHARAFRGGMDPGVACLSVMAWALWMLGYPDHALAKIHSALALARESSHAFSLAFALNYASLLHTWRRELPLAQEQAEALIALSSEHGFIQLLGVGRMRRGWALAEQGAVEEGLAQLHQGLSTWRDNGTELGLPQHLALLAMAYRKGGRVAEGLQVLDEAMKHVAKTWERWPEAEIYRLKGECLLVHTGKRRQVREAEECFQQAIDVARRQQARSLELRAIVSMSHLWRQQGKRVEARQKLTEICAWFREGFDTPDLHEAQALLATLQ